MLASPLFSSPKLIAWKNMSPPLARTGRHRQRYDANNKRLVSGCIPYRLTKNNDGNDMDMVDRIEVLMISSPDRTDLVFPKGGWEDDETVLEAACREALEEAGVRGIVRENPLGVWEFRSKSSPCILEGGCRGYMFALEVTEELDNWPEQEIHDRKWLNIREASEGCRYEWMRNALEVFVRVMEEDKKSKINMEEMEKNGCIPESDVVVAECQIISSNCHVNHPPRNQHNGINGICLPFSWHVPLKRLPLT